MNVRTLHLHGELADRYGAEHPVAAGTIFDAIRIVDCNHPGFCQAIRRSKFHIAVGPADLDEATELLPHQYGVPRSNADWHLVPALEGGKGRTGKIIFSIIVGGALLATGIGGAALGAFAPGVTGLGLAGTAFSISFSTMALMGAGIFLGGLSMLLAPVPKTDTAERKPTTFSFDGPGEIDDEGGPIPIIIGEVITGAVRVASAVESSRSFSLGQYDAGFGSNGGFGGTGGSGGGGGGGGGFFGSILQQLARD
jgi:predicted phage tail protein